MITKTAEPYCITKVEAAKRYGLTWRKCHVLIAEGVIPSIRLGHRTLRIPIKKADAAMDKLADAGKLI